MGYIEEVGMAAGAAIMEAPHRKYIARQIERERARLAGIHQARQTCPNNLGNYKGKRKPKPAVAALTPDERFVRLKAAYEAFRQRGSL
jgi:hypothetical protein